MSSPTICRGALRAFHPDLLRFSTLEAAIAALERADIVRPAGDAPAPACIFRHALVQETAYDTLLHSRRRELRARIAATLEKHFADTVAGQPALLAHHFAQADLPRHAIHWWQLAGERSRRQSANVEAMLQ